MEVMFYNEVNKCINIKSKTLIIGDNNSGKTKLLNKLNSIFSGSESTAYVNGINVTKSLFNIEFIKEDRSIDDEILLKSTSSILKNKLRNTIDDNDEVIESKVKDLEVILEMCLNQTEFDYLLSDSKLEVNHKSLKKLETLLFNMSKVKQLSASAKEEIYIRERLNSIDKSIPTVVFIDNIDRYLSHEVINEILEIYKADNIYFVLTTKNKWILNTINFDSIYKPNCERINLYELTKYLFVKQIIETEKINVNYDDFISENDDIFFDFNEKNEYKLKKLEIINELDS